MAFTCTLLPKAEHEYISAYLWYEEQQTGLGEKFAKAFRDKLSRIALNPKLYSIRKNKLREAALVNFPYLIVFFIEDDSIIINAVFHTKRSPHKKYK